MYIIKDPTKKMVVLTSIWIAVCSMLWAQNENKIQTAKEIQISFTYEKVSGYSSNQFALWVEDEKGMLIKTIYVTKFTATKGWKNRPQSIPLWVKKSNVKEMKKDKVNAISGATPKSGDLNYYWDFTDDNGKVVADGKYTIVLEGTFDGNQKDPSEVIYRALIEKGNTITIKENAPEYIGNSSRGKNMLSKVKYKLLAH